MFQHRHHVDVNCTTIPRCLFAQITFDTLNLINICFYKIKTKEVLNVHIKFSFFVVNNKEGTIQFFVRANTTFLYGAK